MKNKIIVLLSLLALSACSDRDSNATADDSNGTTSFGNTTTATSETEIEQLSFADSNLEACVDAYASNNSFTQISEMTELECENQNIASADGIQNLTALTSLAINNTSTSASGKLTAATAAPIGQLTSLTSLNLNFNDINNIEFLENLTSLESLYLSGNPLSSLSGLSNSEEGVAQKTANTTLNTLTNLRILHLNATGITDITALATLTNLEVLEIESNDGITSIAAISSLTKLTGLNISGTNVSDLTPLSSLTELNSLNLSNIGNKLDLSPLSSSTNLMTLTLTGTSVDSLEPIQNLTLIVSITSPSNVSEVYPIPNPIDTDGDCVPDLVEMSDGTDKNNSNSFVDITGPNGSADGFPDYCQTYVNEQGPIWNTPVRVVNVENSGNAGWSILTNEATPYHWQSDNLEDGESATLTVTVNSRVSELFDFDIVTSTEAEFDILTGTLNGESIGSWSGNTNETGIGVTLQAGENEFVFTYTKDGSVSQGSDNVQVVFPNTSSEVYQIIEGSEVVGFNSTASDPEGNAITYSIEGPDAGLFGIDSDTGEVTFNIAPQFAFPGDTNADNSYELNVIASDSEFNSTLALTIVVNKDTDGDGVPDSVETEQGTVITDATSYQDSDADLVPDYVEEQQGTDPLSAGSFVDENEDGIADYFASNYSGTGSAPFWNRDAYTVFNDIYQLDQTSPLISQPSSVSVADINVDGKLDVVVAYQDLVGWYDNGSNWSGTSISTNAGSGAMVQAALINNDEFPDVIYINDNGNIEVAINPGDSELPWQEREVITDINASVLRVADVDNDGAIDIIVSSYNDGVTRWYKNNGLSGSWPSTDVGQPANTDSRQYSTEIVVTDVNNDQQLDFVIDYSSDFNGGGITLFLNAGDNQSFEHVDLKENLTRTGFYVSDVNGDGSKDLIHFDNSARVVYVDLAELQDEDVTETPQIIASFDFNGADILANDFDADGDVDVIATSSTGRVYLYEQSNGWVRTIFESSASDVVNIVSADLNSDGIQDFVYPVSSQNRVGYVLSNNLYEVNVSEGYTEVSISEVVTNSENDTLAYYLTGTDAALFTVDKIGNITFNTAPDYQSPNDANTDNVYEFYLNVTDNIGSDRLRVNVIVTADNDNDGVPGSTETEQETSDNDASDFLDSDNDGVPDYVELQQGTDPNNAESFLDSDEDGYSDYVEQYSTPAAPFFIGEDVIFGSETIISSTATDAYSVTYADMDGDFDLDIVAVLESVGKVVWYENGNDWSETVVLEASGIGPRDIVASDFDNDGDMDLAAVYHNTDRVVWFEQAETGWNSFSISTDVAGPYRLSLADMNSDGNMDLLVSSEDTGSVIWLRNFGNGTWSTTANVVANLAGARSAFAADVTGNGFKDVVIAGALANSVVLVQGNNSSGTSWSAAQTIKSGTDTTQTVSDIAIGDIDEDGDLDIIQASVSSATISWFENGNAWAETVVSSTATGAHDVELADLDEDGDLDVVAAMDNGDFISWFENGNSWNETKIDNNINAPKSIAIADITGNGVLNVIAAANNDNTVVLFNATIPNLTEIQYSQVEGVRNFINTAEADDINGNDLSFELTGTDAAFFDIDPVTGKLSFNIDTFYNSPDDSNGDNDYRVNIEVSDEVLSSTLSVIVTVLQDSDGDLVPFAVEIEQGTSTTDAADFLDSDSDGVPDYVEEFIEYTDPFDGASFIDEDSNNVADYVDNATNSRPVWQNSAGTEVTSESISIVEGLTAVPYLSEAVDDDTLTIAKQNIGDGALFVLDDKGTVSFVDAPRFDSPQDSNLDNIYTLSIVASDGTVHDSVSSLLLTITVLQDSDGDLVPDTVETSNGTSNEDADSFIDSDSDGVPDYVETNIDFTDANDADSFVDYDGNGSPDYVDARGDAFELGWFEYQPTFELTEVVTSDSDGVHKIIVGEFNGDDKLDIISAAIIDRTIDLYNNNGAWGHNLVTGAAEVQTPSALVEADMDNDGDLDIVAASSSGDVYWLNNGQNWQQEIISNQFTQPSNVAVADMDGDNDLDVVVTASTDGAIHWFENGNSWADNVISDSYAGPQGLAIGDVDGDGDLDIVVGAVGSQNRIDVFINEQNSWTQEFVANRSSAYDVKFADINGDGALDIVTKGTQLTWYDNNSDWTANVVISTSGTNSRGIGIADMDGDGDLDLVTSVTYTSLSWLENDEFGASWTETVITEDTSDVRDIKVADIDGNETLDVVTASAGTDTVQIHFADDTRISSVARSVVEGVSGFNLFIYENSVESSEISLSGSDAALFVLGDDGIQFVQVPEHANALDVNSDNVYEFTLTVTSSEQSAVLDVSLEVLEDSDSDLVPNSFETGQGTNADDSNAFLDSDGDGVPDYVEFYLDDSDPQDATDFKDDNNNSQPDYIDTFGANSAPFWSGIVLSSESTFAAQSIISQATNGIRSVKAADMDRDGDLDILAASNLDDTIAWFENCEISTANCVNWGERQISVMADGASDVVAADMDNDGDLDVVSASSVSDAIVWYENCHTSADNCSDWNATEIYNLADDVRSIVAVDIDNDGDLDLVSGSDNDDTVAWYENCVINSGSCTEWNYNVISTFADGARSVNAVDIDNDGDFDVVAASFNNNSITLYENCAANESSCVDWTITTVSDIAIGASFVTYADMDNDGDADLISAANTSDSVFWYENCLINSGSCNSWTEHTVSDSVDGAKSVSLGDIDNDGDLDVISVSELDNTVAWYENCQVPSDNCTVAWTKTTLSTVANGGYSVITADIDLDGDEDVVSGSFNDDKLAWYENLLFERQVNMTSYAMNHVQGVADVYMMVEASDVDDTDTLTYQLSGTNAASFSISTDGDLSFNSAPNHFGSTSSDTYEVTITVSDGAESTNLDVTITVLQDSDGDMVPNTYESSTGTDNNDVDSFLDSDGDGVPNYLEVFVDGTNQYDASDFLDEDTDGTPDYIDAFIGNEKPVWQVSYGNFDDVQSYAAGDGTSSLAAADIDRDGDLDIVYSAELSGEIAWLPNQGDGTFGSKTVISTQSKPVKVYTGDMNGDGFSDVVVAVENEDQISWFSNDGAGNFSSENVVSLSVIVDGAYEALPVDLDQDGDLDVVGTAYLEDTISWYENDGSGNFTERLVASGMDSYYVDVGDIDGDGDLDIISTHNNNSQVIWFANNGSQVFSSRGNIYSGGLFALNVKLSDVDLDGDLDLFVLSTGDNELAVLENNGTGGFFNVQILATNLSNPRGMTVADITGSGFEDVIVTSDTGSYVAWFENLGDGTLSQLGQTNGIGSRHMAVIAADIDNDGDNDLVSANYGTDDISVLTSDSMEVDSEVIAHKQGFSIVSLKSLPSDVNGDDFTYTLSGTDSDDFEIDDSGTLTFNSVPSYAAPVDANADNVYLITINVSDGELSDDIRLTISVIETDRPFGTEALYLRGTMSGWDASQQMTFDTGNEIYFYDVSLDAAVTYEFKFASSDWSTIDIGYDNVDATSISGLDTGLCTGEGGQYGNICVTPTVTATYRFQLDYSSVSDISIDKPVLTVIQQ